MKKLFLLLLVISLFATPIQASYINRFILQDESENLVGVTSNALDVNIAGSTGTSDVTIVDSLGNAIDSQPDADGDYHLGVALIQSIISSTNNYTDTNLASGATFTGTADETFGINGIQVYHFADRDCIIYIDQSLDATNWDICDTFECLANNACSRTFASVAPYYRARVTNTDLSATTALRFATGMAPVISTLPRSLTDDDRVKVESTITGKINSDRHAWISPTNTLNVNENSGIVGTNFDGTLKDPNFWTETVTGSGAVTQTGEIKLTTGVTANSTAKYNSVRSGRFVVGSALIFTGAYKFNDALVADNIRRCGAYDVDEGFFFELDGLTLNVGSRKVTVDTLISSGDFNGIYGPNFIIDPAVYYKLDIEWTPIGAFYYINNKLLHKSVGGHLTKRLTQPITFENINSNGNIIDVTFDCLGVVISREGKLRTASTYKYISGAANTLCKVGAGDLHSINVTNNSGSVTVYDGTSAAGIIITTIDSLKVQGSFLFDAPFSTGLFIVTTGSAIITVTYE